MRQNQSKRYLLSWTNPKSEFYVDEKHILEPGRFTKEELAEIMSLKVRQEFVYKGKSYRHTVKRVK